MKGKNTYISLFHLLVFCLALLPGSLMHTHHGHEAAELNACRLHIEYDDLSIQGKCEHEEHYSTASEPCFACAFHAKQQFLESQSAFSFTQLEFSADWYSCEYDLFLSESKLNFNKGPPASA